jgi:glycosyltransferase involved in cell wall biosynthesis
MSRTPAAGDMTSSGNSQPARVYTTWGTVLYFTEVGELRHGDSSTVPANTTLVKEGENGCVKIRGLDADSSAIDFRSEGSIGPLSGTPDFEAYIVPLERGLFGLRYGEEYLSAEPDGKITTKFRCNIWEFFLGSEMWCGNISNSEIPHQNNIDVHSLRRYIVDARSRIKTELSSGSPRILIYGYPYWSHGRVYYDVMTRFWRAGIIIDIVNWQVDHSDYFSDLAGYYDFILTAPDGVRTLLDAYRLPPSKLIVVSHHEYDIRMLVEQKGREIFDEFAAYGVVSYYVYCASMLQGVQRKPRVVSLGIDFDEFFEPISAGLHAVGYASSMSVVTFGVEWKRGHLAETATKEARLEFKVAGSTGNQVSFHDMPQFYKGVDSVLTSSISEAAQLPCMEAAAAGRLVIGTPVGHFPLRAYQGGGIITPIEEDRFVSFVKDTLIYYRDNTVAYQDKCKAIQEAARQFDWSNSFHEWVDLINQADQTRK